MTLPHSHLPSVICHLLTPSPASPYTPRSVTVTAGVFLRPIRLDPPSSAGRILELPNSHRIPIGWLLAHGGEVVRYRTFAELSPAGTVPPESLEHARAAIEGSKAAQAVIKKQKDNGIWGGNLLGVAPSAAAGIKDVGTIPQYRRLVQLGLPNTARPFKLADRVLFRLLSRDEDPALLFEYQKPAKGDEAYTLWARNAVRSAATAALAESGNVEDPRVRGAAHKVANEISEFLRSPLAEKPFVRSGAASILHPDATPPDWYSLAMVASMPNLQRERAGFTERLRHYLAQPMPKKAFTIAVGKKKLKPTHLIMGDPIEADSKGVAKDIPLALHFLELLARLGGLGESPNATKVLGRLLKDCDENGVWSPKGLRGAPKATNKASYHTFPLDLETKAAEWKQVDVTFRLAVIAKLMGWSLEYV